MAGAARRAGLPVTVEAAIHHAVLTDAALGGYDPDAVFRPPLRPEADRAAVAAGLGGDGVDVLSSAHSPLPPQAKDRPLTEVEPGAVGLETVLALALTHLDLPVRRLVELLSVRPARLVGLEATQGGPVDRRAAGEPVRDRSHRRLDLPARGRGQPGPQHPLRRLVAAGPGPPHGVPGRGRRGRRGSATMTSGRRR